MPDRLERALETLERVPAQVEWSDVERHLDDPGVDVWPELGPPPERPRWPAVAAVLLLVAATAALVLALQGGSDDAGLIDSGPAPGPAEEAEPSEPSNQQPEPESPSPGPIVAAVPETRGSPVSVWTGERYLVWGGERGLSVATELPADGWALDPATGETTAIPAAPIGGHAGAAGVWTGTEMIVCCGISASDGHEVDTAAAYDPASRTWRRLSDPPSALTDTETFEVSRYAAAVWTGEEVLVVSGDYPPAPTIVAAYDPDADSWRTIDGAPDGIGRQPEVAWTGDELVVWQRARGFRAGADRGHRYDPASDTWAELPVLPEDRQVTAGSIAWTGEELVVWGGLVGDDATAGGARWRPGADVWRPLSDPGLPPIDAYVGTDGSQSLVWDDVRERLLLWPTHGYEWGFLPGGGPGPIPLMAYQPARDSWQRLDEMALHYSPDLTSGDGYLLWPWEDPVVLRPPDQG